MHILNCYENGAEKARARYNCKIALLHYGDKWCMADIDTAPENEESRTRASALGQPDPNFGLGAFDLDQNSPQALVLLKPSTFTPVASTMFHSGQRPSWNTFHSHVTIVILLGLLPFGLLPRRIRSHTPLVPISHCAILRKM